MFFVKNAEENQAETKFGGQLFYDINYWKSQ